MMATKSLAFAAVLACGGVAFAQSQNPMSYEAMAKAKAGSWAEYTMTMKGQPQSIKMKYALVEKTPKTIGFEMESQSPMGPMVVHMMFDMATANELKLVKARMQMGAQTQDVPAAQLASGGIKKNEAPGTLVGTEKVTVPAGTFECKHYTRKLPAEAGGSTVDVWMNDKALPTGLVKMTDSRGAEGVLSAMGSDAKAKMDLNAPAAGAGPAPGAGSTGAPSGGAKSTAPTKK
jgi:hypothetical protein